MNRIFFISLFLTMFSSIFCFAETLNITSENVIYLPYQPIYISAYYEGTQRLSLSPGAGDIVIHVRYNNAGAETQYCPMEHIDLICSDCLKNHMVPSDTYKVANVMNIASDARGWLFDKPGDYLVWLSFTDGSTISNTVSIRVLPPKGEDAAVAEEIKNCRKFSMFVYLEGGDMYSDALATAEKIAGGKSGYSACMRDLLVKNYSQESCTIDGKKRLSNKEKVMHYYDSQTNAARCYSKARTLTLMGRLARIPPGDSSYANVIKNEYKKLRDSRPSRDFDSYINKRLVE